MTIDILGEKYAKRNVGFFVFVTDFSDEIFRVSQQSKESP